MRDKKRITISILVVMFLFSIVQVSALDSTVFEVTDINEEISIDEKFLDKKFKEFISTNYDSNHDNKLSKDERIYIGRMDIHDLDIGNLKGIEYFPSLTYLYCYNNNITSLDLRGNTALKNINCSNNPLTSLDISYLTSLTTFVCDDSDLESIVLPKSIYKLSLVNTNIQSLNLNDYTSLGRLSVNGSKKLVSLQLDNTSLELLDCQKTGLESLDLTKTNVRWLYIQENENLSSLKLGTKQSDKIYAYGCKFKELDISNVIAKEVWINGNSELTDLYIGSNTNVDVLYAHKNNLKQLDISEATIKELFVNDNANLTKLQVGANVMENLYAYNCDLRQIDATNLQAKELRVNNNAHLTDVLIGENTVVEKMYAHNCDLQQLDISKSNIQQIWLNNNKDLSELYTGNNSYLTNLQCNGCALSNIDISENTNLSKVSFNSPNQIIFEKKVADVNLEEFYITLGKDVDYSKIKNLSFGNPDIEKNRIYFDALPEDNTLTYDYSIGLGRYMRVNVPLYIPYHKVTVVINDRDSQTYLVDEEGNYQLPIAPNIDGKMFVGWYFDENFKVAYNGEDILEDTILYALYINEEEVNDSGDTGNSDLDNNDTENNENQDVVNDKTEKVENTLNVITGDVHNINSFLILLMISGLGIIYILYVKREGDKSEKISKK